MNLYPLPWIEELYASLYLSGGQQVTTFDLKFVYAIHKFPSSTSKRQLQSLMDMVTLYRQFLPNCADLMLPLNGKLSGHESFLDLFNEAQTTFERSKASFFDATLPTHLAFEARSSSNTLLVALGLQKHFPTETRYSTFGRHLLAGCQSVSHFQHLLESQDFSIFVDHKQLAFEL
ncbi:unnamed protein product [Schistocephalus solidus]|uniref:Reverse transcriptase RNase H-like domain-containing protein n=1 Tax=Schistocephalus solidus TaxID=70667 RepID=A0A3P7CQ61_SCHSO|nr:unnamed protein product [Schistocephalus solidus]